MLDEVEYLSNGPGRSRILGREQPAGAYAKVLQEEHEDQRQQEVGRGQPDEPDDRKSIVPRRVLVGGGVDAY